LLLFRLSYLLLPGPVIRNLLLGSALIAHAGRAQDGSPGSSRQSTPAGVAGDRASRRPHHSPPRGAADDSRALHWHLGRLGARSRAALDRSRGIESGLVDGPQPALQVVAALLFRTLAT
jgi:hypothetical protein